MGKDWTQIETNAEMITHNILPKMSAGNKGNECTKNLRRTVYCEDYFLFKKLYKYLEEFLKTLCPQDMK